MEDGSVIVVSDVHQWPVISDRVVQSLDVQADLPPVVVIDDARVCLQIDTQQSLLISPPVAQPIVCPIVDRPMVILGAIQGLPGRDGADGGVGPPPFFLGTNELYRVPLNRQVLYTLPIEANGLIEDDGGVLVEMDSPGIG